MNSFQSELHPTAKDFKRTYINSRCTSTYTKFPNNPPPPINPPAIPPTIPPVTVSPITVPAAAPVATTVTAMGSGTGRNFNE